MEEKNIDRLNDIDVLNDIKSSMHDTKYVQQYSTELRIFVYQLRIEHNLSYRKIIEFCQYKYGKSPSVGHIKQLIIDGEKALQSREENHMENSEKNEEISENPDRIRKANEILQNRLTEIESKMVDNDVTTLSKKDLLELYILKNFHNAIIKGYIEVILSGRIKSDE